MAKEHERFREVPRRFAHLVEPIDPAPQNVVIAEITSLRTDDMHGMRKLATALDPPRRLRSTLNGPGGQGWLRTEFNDAPIYREGNVIDAPFEQMAAFIGGHAWKKSSDCWLAVDAFGDDRLRI